MNEFIEEIAGFKLILDPYDGITVDSDSIMNNKIEFEKNLLILIKQLKKENRKLLWITFELKNSNLIETATKEGFTFHNCDKDYVMMVKELVLNPIVPNSPTHTLGVGAIIINDNNEILVIKERVSNIGYKLPGGHIDLGEKISEAVQREVLEETGVNVEFQSITNLGHFHPHQFGKGNLYLLCKCRALSYEINIQDTQEIVEAVWLDVNEFISSPDIFEFVKETIITAMAFKGLKIKELESFKNIPKKYELFFPEDLSSNEYSF